MGKWANLLSCHESRNSKVPDGFVLIQIARSWSLPRLRPWAINLLLVPRTNCKLLELSSIWPRCNANSFLTNHSYVQVILQCHLRTEKGPNWMPNIMQILPELQGDEMVYVQGLLKEMSDQQAQQFAMMYRARRKDPQNVLLLTLLGFIGIAGVQRFIVDQVGMGLLYLFTAGICWIGTIIDLVTHKKIAFEYNQKQATQITLMMRNST